MSDPGNGKTLEFPQIYDLQVFQKSAIPNGSGAVPSRRRKRDRRGKSRVERKWWFSWSEINKAMITSDREPTRGVAFA